MQFDAIIQQALKDVNDLLVANTMPARSLSDERLVICLSAVLGKESVRQALEKANDTAPCFALREVKHVLNQRKRAKAKIDRLWRIMKQLRGTPGVNQEPRVVPWWKRPLTG